VPALLAALKGDPDPGVRRAAIQTLGQLGPTASNAVPGIVGALQSDQAVEVQSAAALALGQIGAGPSESVPVTAVAALADAMTDPNRVVRYQAARALGLLGPAAKGGLQGLQAAREERDPAFQYQAARALQAIDPESERGDRDALDTALEQEVEDLLASFKGSDPERRQEAILVLGTIGPAAVGAVPDIVEALSTAGFASRRGLEQALRAISSEARTQVSILVDDLQPARDPDVRARAADELGQIGADANTAKATLIAALDNPELAAVRFSLADALGEIGSYQTEVTRALAEAALRDSNREVRDNAKESLRATASNV
jgi:HEAT repeat protein